MEEHAARAILSTGSKHAMCFRAAASLQRDGEANKATQEKIASNEISGSRHLLCVYGRGQEHTLTWKSCVGMVPAG